GELVRLAARELHEARLGALLQRAVHELASIRRRTRPCDEAVARAHLAAVAVHLARHAGAQPVGCFAGRAQDLHQNDSSTACTWICGLTFMSGCTPSTRSVCCTVALNTGAATSPPKYLPALGSSIITATTMRG